jgi:hypothetical protein
VTRDDLDKQKIEILMAKYALLRQEIITHINNYKAHVKYFQIIVGIILALAGLMKVENSPSLLVNSRTAWIVAMFFITTVIAYVALDVVQSIYSLIVLGARLATIEEIVNTTANEKILAWESELSGHFHGQLWPMQGVLAPGFFLIVYELFLLLFGLYGIPIFAILKFWHTPLERLCLFRTLASIGLFYSSFSLVLIGYCLYASLSRARGEAIEKIRKIIGRPPVTYSASSE